MEIKDKVVIVTGPPELVKQGEAEVYAHDWMKK